MGDFRKPQRTIKTQNFRSGRPIGIEALQYGDWPGTAQGLEIACAIFVDGDDWGVSIRRACQVFLTDTSTYHYKSRQRGQADLEKRIKEICETRVRY